MARQRGSRTGTVPETCPRIESVQQLLFESCVFVGDLSFAASATVVDPLLAREVLLALFSGNKNPRFAGVLEPSPGLEPGTASLPSWNQGGKRGHRRATATTKDPQVEEI
jgi:hypothetical protein